MVAYWNALLLGQKASVGIRDKHGALDLPFRTNASKKPLQLRSLTILLHSPPALFKADVWGFGIVSSEVQTILPHTLKFIDKCVPRFSGTIYAWNGISALS